MCLHETTIHLYMYIKPFTWVDSGYRTTLHKTKDYTLPIYSIFNTEHFTVAKLSKVLQTLPYQVSVNSLIFFSTHKIQIHIFCLFECLGNTQTDSLIKPPYISRMNASQNYCQKSLITIWFSNYLRRGSVIWLILFFLLYKFILTISSGLL